MPQKNKAKRISYRQQTERLMMEHLEVLRLKMVKEMRFDDAMLLRDVKHELEKVITSGGK